MDIFEPGLFCQSDWTSLEKHWIDVRKLGILTNTLFDKLSKTQIRLEKEDMGVRERCQLVGQMEEYLYELQLVEHALKIPMLGIAKIIFSINPSRSGDRDATQIKQKPAKKRKNELGGLVGDMSDEVSKIPVREAKLLAVSQVHRHQQEERFEEMVAAGSKRGRKRTLPTAARLVTDNSEMSAESTPLAQNGNLMDIDDAEQQQNADEEERGGGTAELADSLLLVEQMPNISEEGQRCGDTNSPQRAESTGNGSQSEQMHSPPRTRATKKKSREAADFGNNGTNEMAELSSMKSPRKRRASATEQQQNEGNGNDQMEAELGQKEQVTRQQKQADEAELTYCLCDQVSFGEMICCDFELCSIEWFHFACVNIKSKPKGKKWFCPLCRYNDKANMLKPELLQKLDLVRHHSH